MSAITSLDTLSLKRVRVYIEQEGGTHVYRGVLVMADETGVLIRGGHGALDQLPLQFFPIDRVVMIERQVTP